MLLRHFYNEKLAHSSYLVGCQAIGEAIVVDPGRDIEPYLKVAEEEGMKIVGSAETHIHADFISGAHELADQVDSTLYISGEGGEGWKHEYVGDLKHQFLKDGETFKIGNLTFEAFHSPGHTPDHMSYVLTDGAQADKPIGIFSGDFVFVGDVGRPDLGETAVGIKGAAEAGARAMFKSLQRFKELPDYLQVWPAHGAGSACGRALGAVPSSTVGYEKMFNQSLSFDNEDAFVDYLLEGQPEPPKYFALMNRSNKTGPKLMKNVRKRIQLDPTKEKVDEILNQGAMLLDTRRADLFAEGSIPGTVNITHDRSFTNWAGWIVNYEELLYLMADPNREDEIARDLYSIGIDNYAGYMDFSSLDNYQKAGGVLQSYKMVKPNEIADKVKNNEVHVIDVRRQSEWDEGNIPGAQHIMLGYLEDRLNEIPKDKTILMQCRSGARSAIAASILQSKGFTNVLNLVGGYDEWKKIGLPVENDTVKV